MTPEIDVLDFSADADADDWNGMPFVLRSYDLADAFGCTYNEIFRDNYGAQDKVRAHIEASDPVLFKRILLDSEMGCFFAYARTMVDALDLRVSIYELLGQDPPPADILT